jgi:hypothetical protein
LFRENRGLYIAALFFAAVAVGFLYLDKGARVTPSSSSSPAAPAPSPVVGLAINQVANVVIHGKGKVLTVSIQADGFTYSLCAEGQGNCQPQPADKTRSAQLFQAVVQLTPTHVVYGAPEGLPAYGADKPTNGEIDVKGRGGQQATILIGNKSTDGANYFLRRQDSNDVVVVTAGSIDTSLFGLIDQPPAPAPTPSPGAAAASPSPS